MSLSLALYRYFSVYYKKMAQRRAAAGGKQVAVELIYLGISLVGSAFLMRWVLSHLDPEKANKEQAKRRRQMVQRRLGIKLETTPYEDIVASEVVNPYEIDVTLSQIGGCERIKQDLVNRVILPLQKPHFYGGRLLRQVKGVLLYGPPGTGKTMLAKALAKESGANFICVKPSLLQSKWYGETQKLVQATFTLAYKLQPCIIFVDEVDALLGMRKAQEHEATTALKTEFMQLWDGMATRRAANVCVLAATNRPFDLDEAILRRFGAQFEVGMPNQSARKEILRIILKQHDREMPHCVDPSLLQDNALARLAAKTEQFSGSDLYELCAAAASIPANELSQAELR
ncbi:AAA-domain-containing protein [Coccomyxa subellipsoidea C-169]|uniref:AAA-domain-containing protein n=1 Tax=Coccomyxa subellipsoidea (strain C-169) TaxID=574566 RepID=I0YP01_COCSC|nr:AAA-domain-containing protein [Coccomyxa subellipsoidea C-169]EIE20120.1 AAA-domain-containing protein [Coccomyxa subellipsoidea C-169]|eukprot:XP_005644664.1 AAA-domain-containing protein [Coccomyxa subellipsoidea C-169]